jgi:hypothetical protein
MIVRMRIVVCALSMTEDGSLLVLSALFQIINDAAVILW